MNNDLISREALKELIEDKLDERYRWDTKLTVCEFKAILEDVINNAPAVDLKAEFLRQRSTGKTGLPFIERPHGEWKPFVYDYDPSIGENHTRPPREGEEQHWEEYWAPEYICSVCGAKNHKTHFCPWCGADMRKGEQNGD